MEQRKKHITPENKAIIDRMLSEGKKIKEIVAAIKEANPDSTISYDNVYNYKKRCEKRAEKKAMNTTTGDAEDVKANDGVEINTTPDAPAPEDGVQE